MNDTLKPCPFCGEEPRIWCEAVTLAACSQEDCPGYGANALAVDWNRRALPQDHQGDEVEGYMRGVKDAVTFLHKHADQSTSSSIKTVLNGMANAIGSEFKRDPLSPQPSRVEAARQLRNYANVLCNMGGVTARHVAEILSLAKGLDGQQPDERFNSVPGRLHAAAQLPEGEVKPVTVAVLKDYFSAIDAGDVPDPATALYSYLLMDGYISKASATLAQQPLSVHEGWMPIDTAPKDGTNIQVWADGFEWPEVVRYELYDVAVAAEIGDPGYWRYSDDVLSDVANVEDEAITHWQPLPPAPTVGGEQE